MKNEKLRVDILIRLFDVLFAAVGLIIFLPIIFVSALIIWKEDNKSPFYLASRSGQAGVLFKMMKLRTMVVDAEKVGAMSTAGDDVRITKIGSVLRRYKLDEIVQLWNVLLGEMSLVGPRPNVPSAVDTYTVSEKQLLSVRPGITDIASIVFSDEGEILRGSIDPDHDYDNCIRPWKSKLALLYVNKRSLYLYFQLIFITLLSIKSRRSALNMIQHVLKDFKVSSELKAIATRATPLVSLPTTDLKKPSLIIETLR
jgi:lipopolysaccharide/colanic/teichoic acid biosynthesis glycosyltransferase